MKPNSLAVNRVIRKAYYTQLQKGKRKIETRSKEKRKKGKGIKKERQAEGKKTN